MDDGKELNREEIAKYANLTGYVRSWEGSLYTSQILGNKQSRWAAALNLEQAIRQYREEVPEDLRNLISIDIDKLERQVLEILENPLR